MENRETFFARVQPFFAPSTIRDIELAYYLAKYGHRAQKRKELDLEGHPKRYFEHLRGTAINVMDVMKCMRAEMIIAGLLHDSIEDTRDLTPELLEHSFGADVCCIVKTVSKVPEEGFIDRLHMCTDWRALAVKGCDNLDNQKSLTTAGLYKSKEAHLAFIEKEINKCTKLYYPIFDKLLDMVPKEYLPGATRLRDEIRKAVALNVRYLEEQSKGTAKPGFY